MNQAKNKFHAAFQNVSLLTKIRTVLISITVLVLFSVVITFSLLYSNSYSARLRTLTGENTLNAQKTISVNARNINQRFVSILGSKDFSTKCRQLLYPSGPVNIGTTDFQDELNDLNNSNYLISASLLIPANSDQVIYSYRTLPRLSLTDFISKDELTGSRGITCLSSRANPFVPSENTLPIVVPLRLMGDFLQINKSSSENDVYIILLLDENKMHTAIGLSSTQSDMDGYCLTDDTGTILYSTADSSALPSAASNWVPEFFAGTAKNATWSWDERYVSLSEIYVPGYCLIGVSKPVSFLSTISNFYAPVLTALLLILFISILLSVIFTKIVTRPLMTLLTIVQQIKSDQYTEKVTLSTHDEVGQLVNAVNDMNDTIHEQIDQIREEESSKYKTELKLLTEQINPHFLYNTLEEIQAEVLRHDTQTASDMIQNLAEYLRVGLSGGSDLIPISSEIRHAQAYVSIMNQRFRQAILFVCRIDPALADHLILKTILQPLIENSIRHGFGIDAASPSASAPTIEVEITSPSENILRVQVTDNGSGFDERALLKIMKDNSQEAKHHVGIHNVYQRLITFYGIDQIRVTAESIPYYQNTITFLINAAHSQI